MALGLALAAAGAPRPAAAHAALTAADPAPDALLATPPEAVALTFSEEVTAAGPGITVIAPSGKSASRGPARAQGRRLTVEVAAAAEGTYLVRWQVIAEDTHPARGSFAFSVGRRGPAPSGHLDGDVGGVSPAGLLLQGLARWLHLLGMALAFGVLAYRALVRPDLAPEQGLRLDRLTGLGVGLLLAAEPAALAGQASSLGAFSPDLATSSFGRALGLRLGAALLFWAALDAVRESSRPRPGRWALLGLGGALALVDGATGHRVPGLPDAAAVALGAVHEAAMAVWLGGLAAVVAVRTGGARFARVALVATAALVVRGAALAVAHLRGPQDLLETAYGAVLAVKVAAVAAVAAIAVLGPRRLEAAAAAAVLALAGLLTSLPPPR